MNESRPDPYYYPGTTVLKNLADIREQSALDKFESDVVAVNMKLISERPLTGSFDVFRLQETHRRIFDGVYPWAGVLRDSARIAKNRPAGYQVSYHETRFLRNQLENVTARLKSENFLQSRDIDTFAKRLAYYYVELDAAHPFRDGNSRTLRMFTGDIAAAAEYRVEWSAYAQTEALQNQLFYARDMGVLHPKTEGAELAGLLRPIIHSLEWERETSKLIAHDLASGITPTTIIENLSQWAPDKGSPSYFHDLVERSMTPEQRAQWRQTQKTVEITAPDPPTPYRSR